MDNTMAGLAQRLLNKPERITVAGKKTTMENIEQRLHVADDLRHKNRLLQHFVSDINLTKAIIFSATKKDADALAQELYEQGHKVAALHGDMNQRARHRCGRSRPRCDRDQPCNQLRPPQIRRGLRPPDRPDRPRRRSRYCRLLRLDQ